jgi:hypothetical protein
MTRTKISESLKREVLTEAGYRCAVPTCRSILAIDLHHIIKVSDGGANEFQNLIALCPNCHALYHRGTINSDSIRVWKGMLISLNGAFDKATIDDLLFLYNSNSQSLELSGDGVLKFSKLISANLAEFVSFSKDNFKLDIKYKVLLTENGKLLVNAWLQGNSQLLQEHL